MASEAEGWESPELEPWLPYFGVHPGIIISESTTWKLSGDLLAVFLFWSGQQGTKRILLG